MSYLNYPFLSTFYIEFELKKMGIECDFPAVKLKSGAGEHVVKVLKKLIDKTLKH